MVNFQKLIFEVIQVPRQLLSMAQIGHFANSRTFFFFFVCLFDCPSQQQLSRAVYTKTNTCQKEHLINLRTKTDIVGPLERHVISNFIWNINMSLPWPFVKLIRRRKKKLVKNKNETRPWLQPFLEDISARICKTESFGHCRLIIVFFKRAYLMKKKKRKEEICIIIVSS